MLAIRMQRTGRKGHAMFRVIVQEAHLTPTSGRVVATLGNYDPHSKSTTLVKDKAELYLKNGAQPSDRVVSLFKNEGIKLPSWVKQPTAKAKSIKNTDKLRRNQPKQEVVEEAPAEAEPEATPEAPAVEAEEKVEEAASEAPAEEKTEVKAEATETDTPEETPAA